MSKRTLLIGMAGFFILASILACNLTPPPVTPPDGGGPGPVTDTPDLPPPAATVLRVAYLKGDNVWLWTEGAGSLQLTAAGGAYSPSLSADGQVVAFLRNGELWAVDSDGSDERVLVNTAYLAALVSSPDGDYAEVNDHVWLPGSHTIYFNTLLVAGIAGYRIPRFDLYNVEADVSPPAPVNLEAEGDGGVPYVSPDNTVLALANSTKVIFRAVDGSFRHEALSFPFILTYSEWAYVPELVWLADSSGVRVVVPASDPLGDPTEVSTFWNVPVSGAPVSLTTFLAAPIFMGFPYISPDGSTVFYAAQMGTDLDLHTIDAGGTDTPYGTFPTSGVGLAGWTPDSLHFMYWQVPTQWRIKGPGVDNLLGDTPAVTSVRWIDGSRFLFLNGNELRLTDYGSPSSVIDAGVSEFDFGLGE